MTPTPPSRIYLIGPMGSGKTTVGRRLARQLNMDFVDCDEALEAHTGASVQLVFEIEGEAGFRKRETDMLRKLAERENTVIATGGGVVTVAENTELMRATGLVIYLQTEVERQLRRLSRDQSRPLLQAPDRRERLEQLAARRNPLYDALADITLPSHNLSLDNMARLTVRTLNQHLESLPGNQDTQPDCSSGTRSN